MSAVNVIIKHLAVISVGTLLLIHGAGDMAWSRANIRESLNAPSLFDRMTEKDKPAAFRQSVNGNGGDNDVTEIDVIGIINTDEEAHPLVMPNAVFCDQKTDETYVVDNGRVTVYGGNLFPTTFIGEGRGAKTPLGVYVDKQGNVYVLQAAYYDKPHRITVYNAAFVPVREIDLGAIPGSSNPKSMAIGANGNMYVTFTDGVRGLLVLDKEGNFSHWLKPMDLILDQAAILKSGQASELEEEQAEPAEEGGEPDFDISELVPQLVPKRSDQIFSVFDEPGMGPVQVTDVQVDSDGNIYILSIETSKVYIYNPEEEFMYSFGEKGGSTGKLSQPKSLVIDEKKKAIYIVDATRHAVLIYDLSGRFMHEFGGQGNRPGWFQYPNCLAVNGQGQLVVADKFNRRVQVLDVHFQYKFPLFQVPFVYDPNDIFQPMPIRTTEHYAPGLYEGHALLDLEPGIPEEEQIMLMLMEETGDAI